MADSQIAYSPPEAPEDLNTEERTIWDERTMLPALQTIENPALHLAVHLSMILSLRAPVGAGEILGYSQPGDLAFDAADGRGAEITVNKAMQRANKEKPCPRSTPARSFTTHLPGQMGGASPR